MANITLTWKPGNKWKNRISLVYNFTILTLRLLFLGSASLSIAYEEVDAPKVTPQTAPEVKA